MRPDDRDLDEEIRGHLALSVQERVDAGEAPEAARIAALREFGHVPAVRESMRRVWHSRWLDAAADFVRDIRIGLRSLLRAKGLAATVVVTLALGIGANAAIFSVVREVLLRPLVNRDQDRLIYVRQSAPGIDAVNTTFSVPEIHDLRSRVTTVSAFGEFSTIDLPMIGLGDPRVVHAGVVNGGYFDVIGLRPVVGRLLDASDDGPDAAGAAVLTHRFWSMSLNRDPAVIGRTIRLGTRPVTVVGVLEPSVPYPVETEIIANIVTSPHHLGATMVTQRTHRMTELFGRLVPGVTIEAAREEMRKVHATMMAEHPEAYSTSANIQLSVSTLRDQITAPARTILLVLLAAALLVFVIACSNVVNLVLARTVRRERELAVRAALGASTGAIRRTLLAESLVLCGAGATLAVLLARPLVPVIGRYAERFSIRALDVTVDASLLWVGAGLAMIAAVLLAYLPKLPLPDASTGAGSAIGRLRVTPGTDRRLRIFATTQVALSFVLLVGAGMLLTTLVALQTATTGYNLRQVLAVDVALPIEAFGPKAIAFVEQLTGRVERLPGVERVAAGNVVPWRDSARMGAGFRFAVDSPTFPADRENPHGRLRTATPGLFATLGVPIVAGRDFTERDKQGSERVVIVSQSIAQLFPNGQAVNQHLWWTDPYFGTPQPCRIVGVAADVDDENVVPGRPLTIYHPFLQMPFGDRLFVRAAGDPYALVAPVTKIIRELSADQPVEHAATLADVRAEVLAPERLNAFVLSRFGGVALLIAVVGVAGVLAFSVSARTREFGVRLAIGSTPWQLMIGVLSEGASIVTTGILAGAAAGSALGALAIGYVENVRAPGVLPVLGAAAVLTAAAIGAALMPAARASRIDVMQALRPE